MNKYQLIIGLLLSFSLIFELSAQSLKKMYSHLEKNNLEKAVAEHLKFTKVKSYEDIFIFELSSCLILINENYPDYAPYKALAEFEATNKKPANLVDVDKFLKKYKLSIEKVQNMIYEKILYDAKKENTEESFQKALEVCKNCFYNSEANKLMELAAYSEAKQHNTISALNKFTMKYPQSEFIAALTDTVRASAFNDAMEKMTIASFEYFLNNFEKNGNKYYNTSLHLRDSIAFSHVRKSYSGYTKFLKDYPDTQYTQLIKNGLPELHYNEALRKNDIDLLELFILNYPNDSRVHIINEKREFFYYHKLTSHFTLSEFESFKRKFPDSRYSELLKEKLSNVIANSDLTREGLNGPVESITVTQYRPREGNRIEFEVKQKFNEFGYIVQYEPYNLFSRREHRGLMADFCWHDFEDENRLLFIGQEVSPRINVEYRTGSAGPFEYEYDGAGLLRKVWSRKGHYSGDFSYNENDELVERNIWQPGDYLDKYAYRILYDWIGGRLICKRVYKKNGDLYRLYEIEYSNNRKIITAKDERKLETARISIDYDSNGKMIRRKVEDARATVMNDIAGRSEYCSITEYTYSYCSKGKLVEIEKTNKFKGQPSSRTGAPKRWTTTFARKYPIHRDSHGQITSIGSNPERRRYEYEYDSYGNWIEVKVFDVKKQDIEIKTILWVINRDISYY